MPKPSKDPVAEVDAFVPGPLRGCLAVACVWFGSAMLGACSGQGEWLRKAAASNPHLMGRSLAPHRVAILDTGRDALLYRIEQFRAARSTIKIQTFILSDDVTSRVFLHELVLAARRGVRVQILADAMFSETSALYVARMVRAHANIELRAYNPVGDSLAAGAVATMGAAMADFGRVNQRMHNKLVVIDGKCGICGGRNYEDKYFDEGSRLTYRDRDVVVFGPVVAAMDASFDAYWKHRVSVPVASLADVAAQLRVLPAGECSWPFDAVALGTVELAARADQHLARGAVPLHWHDVARVAFWADTPGKPAIDRDEQSVALRLIGAIGNARHEIVVQSPYLVLTDVAIELLQQVHGRGVSLQVQTNSLASTDNWASYAHSLRQRREMLEDLGMEIFELRPQPAHVRDVVPNYDALVQRAAAEAQPPTVLSLHAKSMVVDRELALVGSYNLDPRSEALNTEVLLAIWDPDVAEELRAAIGADASPANSWVIAAKQRGLVRWMVDGMFEQVNAVMKTTTTLDPWPIQWSSAFALRDGRRPVPRFSPAFYDAYEDLGTWPEVSDPTTAVLVRLSRALTGFARMLM